MRYTYSLIRFVPDPFRDERVNVGAIVGSELTGEWDIIQVSRLRRARALQDKPGTVLAIADFIERQAELLDPFGVDQEEREPVSGFVPSEDWLTRLSQSHDRVVQLSEPTPVSAESLAEALEVVGARFLVDPERSRARFHTKTFARLVARELYLNSGLEPGTSLLEEITLETLHASERIDFAVVNGRALQLTQAWSFQLPRQDELMERIKAWGWSLSRVREHSGKIRLDGRVVNVPDDVELAVVYVPPTDATAPALDAAEGVFDDLNIQNAPIDDAEEVTDRGAELLAAG